MLHETKEIMKTLKMKKNQHPKKPTSLKPQMGGYLQCTVAWASFKPESKVQRFNVQLLKFMSNRR